MDNMDQMDRTAGTRPKKRATHKRRPVDGDMGTVDLMDGMDQMDRTAGARRKKRATHKRRPVDGDHSVRVSPCQSVSVRVSPCQSITSIKSISSIEPIKPPNHFPTFFSQSLRNASIPLSVRGCAMSWVRILYGTVAMCAPAMAASRTCKGLRTLATMILVANP
jgi:hypothetical protein